MFTGIPSIFIRTFGCNLQCHFCFPENTPVKYSDKGAKKIKDVKIGDNILTIDDKTGSIIDATVLDIMKANIMIDELVCIEYLNDKGYKTKIFPTKDHLFYVKNKGWVEASNLINDDIILSVSSSQAVQYHMRLKNPMKDKNISLKVGRKISEKASRGEIDYHWLKSEEYKKLRQQVMLTNNPMKNPLTVVKQTLHTKYKKSSLETKYDKFFIANKFPVQYTGNNKIFIGDKNDKFRFPDFIVDGKNKVIEIFDSLFERYIYKGKTGIRDEQWKNDTINFYKKYGYECVLLSEKDYSNISTLKNKVMNYVYNGCKVLKVSNLTNKQKVKFTGSLENYKWTLSSDIDLHLILDLESLT